MSGAAERPRIHSCRLPNGMSVASLSDIDTLMVYRDIFDDDCYRRCGVTISEGDCILDVGANTGLFILFLNEIMHSARIYAFEPVPAIYRVLRRNVEMHDRLATRTFNVGLSHRPGAATFTYYPRMSNASTMYPDASARAARLGRDYVAGQFRTLPRPLAAFLSHCPATLRNALADRVRDYFLKDRAVACELQTLSGVLAEHGITRVDLLKVDAEQSERHILDGLDEDDWPKIRQVIVEVHEGDEVTRDIAGRLGRRGFRTAMEPNPTFPSLSLVYGVRPDSSHPT